MSYGCSLEADARARRQDSKVFHSAAFCSEPTQVSWNFHWSRGPEHFCRDRGTRTRTVKRSPAGPETRADDPTVRKQTQRFDFLLWFQQSCNSSSSSPDTSEEPCPTDMVKMTKSKTFQAYLPSCHRTYSCIHCRAHLANHDELISKSFQGSQGRAYLFNSVVNVGCGPAEERVLLTGLHAVADIYCENCKTTLGWKYEHAFESSQKYKEGKFIIELAHMIKDNGWE
ncbi:hypothetical protein NQZ68_028202 [Dissostichus eleginoides]|nr:hypothetical protein NQZ68_028202 [Dissostichus eleginoides]